MVFEAIKALKERNGSSIQAIKKHITTTHPTLNFTPHQMRSALKKGVESGKFIKVGKRALAWLFRLDIIYYLSSHAQIGYRTLNTILITSPLHL